MPFPQLHNKSHKSLFIIDDEPSIREVLKLVLELEGYRVATASSAEEAIKKLSTLSNDCTPCLILCDLMMPGMSGIEFANYLKNNATLVSIPIALMTASAVDGSPGRQVIRKPFSIDIIVRLAHDACEKNVKILRGEQSKDSGCAA